mmetsp:Transcript_26081/g.41362  ORF Transcript_26081/g.41362 Transcript_26081/m.41362 type:complete len:80 (-) Transcript_26081:177-416(-)
MMVKRNKINRKLWNSAANKLVRLVLVTSADAWLAASVLWQMKPNKLSSKQHTKEPMNRITTVGVDEESENNKDLEWMLV